MPFIPVANTIEVELRCLLDNQRIENTLWFEGDSAPTVASATALINVLDEWWVSAIGNAASNTLTLVEIKATDQSSPTGFVASLAGSPLKSGQNAFPAVPNNCALAVSFRTAQRGRSARGRNYVPGIDRTRVDVNTVQATTVSNIVTAYNSLIGLAADNGYTWVVASRFSGGVPRIIGQTLPVIQAVCVDNTLDSQRRRLPKRGQ